MESSRPVVPVSWLQTEDHDLKEIATIQVGRPQGEPLTPSLPSSPADRVSVAHATLAGELLAALEADPLSFSSSALLRPVVQDTLPPTAAYVGGPAEVAYFAQLGPLYEVYGLPRPLVVPRARFRVVDEKTAASVRGSVQKLAAKYRAALPHRDATRVEELRRVQRVLHPGGIPQERVFGLATFAARFGERGFIARVPGAIDPFDPTLKDIR